MAQILFMENSRPLQRQLLSGLHRMPPGRFRVFTDCISLQVCPVHASSSPQRIPVSYPSLCARLNWHAKIWPLGL